MWLADVKLSERAGKLAAAETNQDQSFDERARKLAAENSDINDENDSKWPHNYSISRANVPHLEKIHSNLRKQLKRRPEDNMEDLDVNTLILGMFMVVTQQAPVHLGNDYVGSLHSAKKSSTKNSDTIVRCDKKVGQRADRNTRFFHDGKKIRGKGTAG